MLDDESPMLINYFNAFDQILPDEQGRNELITALEQAYKNSTKCQVNSSNPKQTRKRTKNIGNLRRMKRTDAKQYFVIGLKKIGKTYQVIVHYVTSILVIPCLCGAILCGAQVGCLSGIAYSLFKNISSNFACRPNPIEGCLLGCCYGAMAGILSAYTVVAVVDTSLTFGHPLAEYRNPTNHQVFPINN
ncbi:hypothetical protein niasHS_007892 [Heterodera schachtii]|uniref:Uncharacterized protein n=1 Tax=Heterodera schachtii TaxID=97005 RepID=A0ABD2JQ14_HETSC